MKDHRGRDLSGITPSGRLTLGNHLGALRRFVERQDEVEGYYFVSDLHALTLPQDPARLRETTLSTAATLIAAGLDPARSTVFVQSQVPTHVEMSYLLECTAYVGELSRMIQFKEKGGRPRTRASLFTYPCLMAADILLYDADRVPVGGDQSQHVELTRDLAIRFNATYGDTLVVPQIAPAALAARVTDLQDPRIKMSKSAPDDALGVVRVLDTPDAIALKIRRAVTDSDNVVTYDPAAKPGVSNLLDILAVLTRQDPQVVADSLRDYGSLKRAVTAAVVAELEPLRRRHDELMGDRAQLAALLAVGADKALRQSSAVLERAKKAVGLTAARLSR
ncbi:tryptophan--tRNA ligase [Nocardioides KLBMP 9356]|uniref:Tryptophan--tRNA ligase n=1 Tax=Nocardioides potassii TaxID=2911371 RepID=A0ABS9HE01_9ACTN|nr:tryptophan--tRNA ligase [Nocardioides potassii]MCF6378729.1 tryptophan--tRNA ligase [Nocardioides potassii]